MKWNALATARYVAGRDAALPSAVGKKFCHDLLSDDEGPTQEETPLSLGGGSTRSSGTNDVDYEIAGM